jgi:hypothetical protein
MQSKLVQATAFAALTAALLLLPYAHAQDGRSPYSKKDPKAHSDDDSGKAKPPRAGSNKYADNYGRAVGYLKDNFGKSGWRVVPDLFAGLVFLLDGRPEFARDLERAIQLAKRKVLDDKAFNGNWFVSYSALFLAIVYSHHALPDVKEALEEGFRVAMRTREDDTLGWGHNKGWGRSSGYYKKGGAVDLGIVTATMLTAAVLARENGVQVPKELIDGAVKNLESISRNGWVAYGTENRWTGFLSRSAAAFPGLHAAGMKEHSIYKAVAEGLSKDYPNIEKGHAYGPIHFFADAIAGQIIGNYSEMADRWLPELSSRQQADGSTSMQHDGGTRGKEGPEMGATAVYALMVLMQTKKLVPAPRRGAGAKGGGGSGSPFSRPKIDPKDVPTGDDSAPKGPVTGEGNKNP